MKIHAKSKNSLRYAIIALVASVAPLATAQNNSSAQNSANANDQSSRQDSITEVRVTRATNYLGADVTAKDGRKVGDIADFVYDTSAAPHLKYVVVVTGGFLGYGGEARAVPASAVTTAGDSAKLDISSSDYWDVALLPMNRERFLGDADNRAELAKDFNLDAQNDREGSEKNGERRWVSFSELSNSDVYDREGRRIGRFVDTWVSLDHNRSPYVEISAPPASPFEVLPRTRFAVPMNRLQANTSDGNGYRLEITEADLRDSDVISETEGVKMQQSGEVGKAILRVRVAQR